MTSRSFKVRFYDTEIYKGKRGTTYTVRWTVNGRRCREPFKTSALADSFRASLIVAANNGEPFDMGSGLPASLADQAKEMTWYDFAVEYVDVKWPQSSGHNRVNTAKALTKVTVAVLPDLPAHWDPVELRRALREFAFNKQRRNEAPENISRILSWVKRSSPSMSVWQDSRRVDAVMRALNTRLDGTPVAASSANRDRRILNVAMKYAVRQKLIASNPLPRGRDDDSRPKAAKAIDRRSLLNSEQVSRLLAWIGDRPKTGYRLRVFFATLYYAGLRSEEAVALRRESAALPEAGWGEFLVHTAEPEVGSRWTDDGAVHETRELKGRAVGDTRVVPVHPDLVAMLRDLIERDGIEPQELLFPGHKGGLLGGTVFRGAWRRAREAVLDEHEYRSPVGKRVYDLRHTCLTTWLNSGVPPAQVAEWAGNSVPVLLSTYARCVTGQTAALLQRVEGPQRLPDQPPARPSTDQDSCSPSERTAVDGRARRTTATTPSPPPILPPTAPRHRRR